jgi:TetR/AcrR family transcriptional repressor of nem operon
MADSKVFVDTGPASLIGKSMINTKTKILNVAEELIQRLGCNAMSYNDISEAVGIRKASIHHHFAKKEDLINELLKRCRITYGNNYQKIADSPLSAPEKLRNIAKIFKDGLRKQQLCLVGTISADKNTLKEDSRDILEDTIKNTIGIFTPVFEQGKKDDSLSFIGTSEETAYAFFSFLLGAQIATRVYGGEKSFQSTTEAMISNWEKPSL